MWYSHVSVKHFSIFSMEIPKKRQYSITSANSYIESSVICSRFTLAHKYQFWDKTSRQIHTIFILHYGPFLYFLGHPSSRRCITNLHQFLRPMGNDACVCFVKDSFLLSTLLHCGVGNNIYV